ncbi:MAG TPA: amidohydrolase family protein [Acidimicrobiales bacterium]
MAELVIRGGTVVDGTGAPGRPADVVIEGGRIAAVGEGVGRGRSGDGATVLDAAGCVVAPGFIDIHTHYDAQVFWDPRLTPSCFHGVTTVVAGNCGFSIAPTRPEHRELIARTLENVEDMDLETLAAGVPWDFATFPEYLDAVERRGLGLNFACYLGHTALRLFVMGEDAFERAATEDEVAAMQAVLAEGLDAGAIGFATSFAPTHQGADGKPVPSRLAERSEVEALLATLGEHRQRRGRGRLAEFTVGEKLRPAELYDLQPAVGVPFTYTALLTTPNGNHRRLAELNEAGWAQGAQVWPQVSPRPLQFSMTMTEPFTLNPNPEFAALMSASVAERVAAYADPEWRRRAVAAWDDARRGFVPRWDTYRVAESDTAPELIGRTLTDIAAERGTSPFEALCDLAAAEPGIRVACYLANDDPDEVAHLLVQDHVAYGLSDAGAHVGQLCDACQATDLLGNWVRERQVLPLEDAVHRLTGRQADLLGWTDRGRLAPGQWADVVVFDPETVAPGPIRRVHDFPGGASRLTADQPEGIRHVVVNGTPIRRDGEPDPAPRPGRLVR